MIKFGKDTFLHGWLAVMIPKGFGMITVTVIGSLQPIVFKTFSNFCNFREKFSNGG